MQVNDPAVVAEVTALFRDYEAALSANDVDVMNRWFWDGDATVRYGIAECLYGADAIAEWRRRATPVPAGRQLANTVVTTFGSDVATVSTEFGYPGDPSVGRQQQTWVRLEQGWRIVAAHVSTIDPSPASG